MSEKKYSNAIAEAVKSVLDVRDDEYMVYTYCPVGVDENDDEMMLRMTEFICRVNYGLRTGNFELDCNDGEIRFKCHVICEDIIPTAAIVNRSIYTSVLMFERYGSGILDIIFTDASPKDAVYKCENSELDMYRRIRAALNGEDDSTSDDSASDDSEIDAVMDLFTDRFDQDSDDSNSEQSSDD